MPQEGDRMTTPLPEIPPTWPHEQRHPTALELADWIRELAAGNFQQLIRLAGQIGEWREQAARCWELDHTRRLEVAEARATAAAASTAVEQASVAGSVADRLQHSLDDLIDGWREMHSPDLASLLACELVITPPALITKRLPQGGGS